MARRFGNDLAFSSFKADGDFPFVPWEKGIIDNKSDFCTVCGRIGAVFFEKLLDVNDSSHDIRANGFFDVSVVQLEGDRITGIGTAPHFVNHRVVRANVFP